jgi:chromosome segregation ATPase
LGNRKTETSRGTKVPTSYIHRQLSERQFNELKSKELTITALNEELNTLDAQLRDKTQRIKALEQELSYSQSATDQKDDSLRKLKREMS